MVNAIREYVIAEYLKRLVKRWGGWVVKIKGEGVSGIPDYLVAMRGQLYLVETKRPKGGRLSPRQVYVIGQLAEIGVKVWVTFTKEEVENFVYGIYFS